MHPATTRGPRALVLVPLLLLAALTLLGACAGMGRDGSSTTEDMRLRDQAIEHLEAGEIEEARRLLDTLLIDYYIANAEELLAANAPEDALLDLDRVLDIDPTLNGARLLKAEGSLALAEKAIAERGSALLVEGALQDALEFYDRCEEDPRVLLGASRSAWLLNENERALEYARRAMIALDEAPHGADELQWEPRRVLIEAAFSSYAGAKSEEGREADASAYFEEAYDAMAEYLARHPGDPWIHGQVSDLYEWEERWIDARTILEQGLDRIPENEELMDRLVRITYNDEGRDKTIEAFQAYNQRHPRMPLGLWYEARQRFDFAVQKLMDGEPEPDQFESASKLFEEARTVDPTLADAAISYEVMCPGGVGWSLYQIEDFEGATQAFLSMEDVRERGMEWSYGDWLLSGVSGLEYIGAKYNELENWEGAATVFEQLRQYQPDMSNWANNAGFFFRDAGVEVESLSRRLCRAANGEIQNEESLSDLRAIANVPAEADAMTARAAFRLAAGEKASKARQLMQKSWEAYKRASELAPDDVRIVNDTGLVQVYYLHTEHEEAEAYLLKSVEMGKTQLAEFAPDEELSQEEADAKWELENAWGDAYQNLGVLAWLRGDNDSAREWFRESERIGPDPRPLLTNFWLPFLDGEQPEQEMGEMDLEGLRNWGTACAGE